MPDESWDPDKENEPLELQRRQVELGEELVARMRKEDAEKAAREAEYVGAVQAVTPPPYKYPTFEEVSARLKQARDEVDRIMLAAEPEIKFMAFQVLYRAASGDPFAQVIFSS